MFKLVLKGILLYITVTVTLLWFCAIDSITDNGYLFHWTFTVIILILLCKIIINKDEFDKLI